MPPVSISLPRLELELVATRCAWRPLSCSAHDTQQRWGSLMPQATGSIILGGGVHLSQKMMPQPRQWCRRTCMSKRVWHDAQLG